MSRFRVSIRVQVFFQHSAAFWCRMVWNLEWTFGKSGFMTASKIRKFMLVFLGEVVKPYFEKIPGIPCKALNLLNFVTSAIFRSCASLKFSIYDRNSRLPSLIWKAVSVKYITDVSPHHFHILYYLMLLLYFK